MTGLAALLTRTRKAQKPYLQHILLQTHASSKAPSLHGRYPASTLLWASPTPAPTRQPVIDSLSGGGPCWHRVEAGLPSSRLFVRLAPSPLTPEGSAGALDRCFPANAGFTISGRLATLAWCNEADLSSLVVTARACDGRGSKLGIAPHLARPSSCVTINSHGKLLSVCANSRASLGAPENTEKGRKEENRAAQLFARKGRGGPACLPL